MEKKSKLELPILLSLVVLILIGVIMLVHGLKMNLLGNSTLTWIYVVLGVFYLITCVGIYKGSRIFWVVTVAGLIVGLVLSICQMSIFAPTGFDFSYFLDFFIFAVVLLNMFSKEMKEHCL